MGTLMTCRAICIPVTNRSFDTSGGGTGYLNMMTIKVAQKALILPQYNRNKEEPLGNWARQKANAKLSLYVTKYRALKTYWGSGGIAPCILDVGTRWKWVVSFTPRPLCTHCIADWVGLIAGIDAMTKRKISHHCPCRELNPSRPARLTELSRLSEARSRALHP
jgi:hypothetical protein